MTTQHLLPARLALTAGGLVLAIALTVCMSMAAHADVLSHYEPKSLARAEKALERGKPDLALKLLHRQRAIVRDDKHLARSQSLTCRAYMQKGEYETAEPACNTAVARGNEANLWRHLNNRGALRLAQGRYSEAEADFRRAALLNPASRAARHNLQLAKSF
ncbi:tetratricopeptide repeat protein [Seongchinamella unica]|uniref:Tetratricopeptide repeat protein n=1 Tax=Seongchinamella unica TaxID=2547392 RepID=A0A4R5LNC8_9GAMM|nr:tetratricopeptide repeat protein [Seongchinamella unica]TDG11824.1 tetratricopeptide repeat protein [Seongchinamella unica]